MNSEMVKSEIMVLIGIENTNMTDTDVAMS
jgi:hypothetical protein